MSLSAEGQAKIDRILRYCQVPVFDKRRTTAGLMAAHVCLGKDSAYIGLSDLIPVIARYADPRRPSSIQVSIPRIVSSDS